LFSRREVCAACGWTYAQVRTHLERLIEVELVATRAGRNGAAMLYELLMDANAAEEAWQIGLIDVAKLKGNAGILPASDGVPPPSSCNYDPNLDGKKGDLDPPCESPPSSPEA